MMGLRSSKKAKKAESAKNPNITAEDKVEAEAEAPDTGRTVEQLEQANAKLHRDHVVMFQTIATFVSEYPAMKPRFQRIYKRLKEASDRSA